MVTKFFDKPVFVIFLMILLIIISIPFQRSIDQSRSTFRAIENTLYLTSSMLKKASLGYYELISDIELAKIVKTGIIDEYKIW